MNSSLEYIFIFQIKISNKANVKFPILSKKLITTNIHSVPPIDCHPRNLTISLGYPPTLPLLNPSIDFPKIDFPLFLFHTPTYTKNTLETKRCNVFFVSKLWIELCMKLSPGEEGEGERRARGFRD